MRGGSSKGIYMRSGDLPPPGPLRDAVLLRLFGSPDPRQIDGLGGADVLTSKLAIVGPPTVAGADVDYTFGQVSFAAPHVDYKGNCGNISAGVGPFAIDEGLLPPAAPGVASRTAGVCSRALVASTGTPHVGHRPGRSAPWRSSIGRQQLIRRPWFGHGDGPEKPMRSSGGSVPPGAYNLDVAWWLASGPPPDCSNRSFRGRIRREGGSLGLGSPCLA